ncbi:MAG: HEAT repeat domain-containing protein [Fimbriimonas sp.]|nr:HEAT repeat domain-containing protein [Fimbriimonas sp.]
MPRTINTVKDATYGDPGHKSHVQYLAPAAGFSFEPGQTDLSDILAMDQASRLKAIAAEPGRFVPLLIRGMQDRDKTVRQSAAIALRDFDPPIEDDEFRDTVDAIEQMRPIVVGALSKACRDSDPMVRDGAVESLATLLRIRRWGQHGEAWYDVRTIAPLFDVGRSAVPTLIKLLAPSNDQNYSTQVTVLVALRRMKDRRALPALLSAIDRMEGACLREAMQAAIQFDDPRVATTIVRNISKTIPDYSGSPGIWALKKIGVRAVPALIAGVSQDTNASVRAYCALALAEVVDKRAMPSLIRALGDSDEFVRRLVASALGSYQDRKVVQALCRAADDSSSNVRAMAIASLVGMREGESQVVRALQDPDPQVRVAAVGIARIDRERGIRLLLPLLKDPDLKMAIMSEFRQLHDRRTVPALLKIGESTSDNGQIEVEAGMALAEMKVPEAIPILVRQLCHVSTADRAVEALALYGNAVADRLLKDFPESIVDRHFFIEALGNAGDPRACDLLRPLIDDPRLVGVVAVALGKLHDQRAVLSLIVQLDSHKGYLASDIAEGLGYLGCRIATSALIRTMNDREARPFAAAALARIGDPASLETLIAFLSTDEEGRWMAIEWMASFKDPRVFDLLVKCLKEDWPASAASARALGRYGDPRAIGPLRRAALSEDEETMRDATEAVARLARRSN